MGYPTLLVTSEIGNPSIVKFFHFDDEGFYTYVQIPIPDVDRRRSLPSGIEGQQEVHR